MMKSCSYSMNTARPFIGGENWQEAACFCTILPVLDSRKKQESKNTAA